MAPQYYNEVMRNQGIDDIYCEYFNLPQFLDKKTDDLILVFTQIGNQIDYLYFIIKRGNTFPHARFRLKVKK